MISEFVGRTPQLLRLRTTLQKLIDHLSPLIVEEEREEEDVDMNSPTCGICHNQTVDQPTPVFVCTRCGTAIYDYCERVHVRYSHLDEQYLCSDE